jgi:hypothetical protein
MGGRYRARGDGRVDAPAAAPAETAGTMRRFCDWLEDKLAEEPKETPEAPTMQRVFLWVLAILGSVMVEGI